MLKPFPWQQGQWRQIVQAEQQGRPPHALLLTGADTTALRQFAYALAARLLCRKQQDGDTACGACKSCVLFQAGNHPDLLDIVPEQEGKQIKVESIRQLVEYVQIKSQYAEYKLVIINPAEAMNRSAANSLLKTLEEPPAKSVLLLLAAKAALLPVTVRSRCQRLNFPASHDDSTVQWLQSRLKDEKIKAAELLQMAQGYPLKALQILETDGFQAQLNLLDDLEALSQQRIGAVKTAEKWLARDAREILRDLLEFFVIMGRLKLGAASNNSTVHRHLQRMVKSLDWVQLIQCYDMLVQHYDALSGPLNLNKQGLLEDFIVLWQSRAEQRGG